MSNVQIPNLPASTALNGTEQLEAVQSGTSTRITTTQIAQYTATTYPAPGISSVTANSPLTSSTVSGAVTITLPSQSVTNTYLALMAAGTVKANLTGGSATPSDVTPSAILNTFGTQTGSMLYRGASGWQALTAGTNTQVLTSNGTTSAPSWQTLAVPSGSISPTGVTAGTYGSATQVPQFTVLASGQLSVAANVPITIPAGSVTGLGTMATQNANNVAITGGAIDGTQIGATTASTGRFSALTATGTSNFSTIASGTWNGTAIGVAYGGTGATTAAGARTNLGAASSGANSDITSLSGLTTALSAPQGGTGFTSYTTGDLLFANTSTTLSRLNDVATGNALISGGVGVAPSWGKIDLTTHVSGTLPVANGGTGATTLTGYVYGNGTGAFTASTTIPNAGLDNSSLTIGTTTIALGATSTTLDGLTTVTLTQDPTAALQASTKQYVDNQVATVSNQTFHTASYATTTANLNATYANGTGGVGATLTNAGAFAIFDTDGTTPPINSRILVKDQTAGLQNGIYTLTTVGDAVSIPWVLTRASDFNTVGTGPNYIETGAATFVNNGSAYGASGWVMTTTGTITVGSTALTFTQTSSSSSITVSSPLLKTGSNITLQTVPVNLGGTDLTSYTQYGLLYAPTSGSLGQIAVGTSGYPLISGGSGASPAFSQLSLTAGVSGILPVANGGTGTSTAFTAGSVVFAGPSGVYAQDNSKLFWDDTNNRLGINTATPQVQLTILSNTQTTTPTSTLPSGTDLYIVGANAANTRITQDAYGTGAYPAYTGRMARGTAASPTATQTGDILVEVTGRGYGATAFSTSSVVRIDLEAAENFTDTAQGTYISLHTSALGAATAVERFRIGPSGQLGIGGATYGTTDYVLTSAGASSAPTWSQVSLTAGISGVLPVANGGTNISSYTIGDLLYASGATTLSKLADVATGSVLVSGGVGAAPAYSATPTLTSVTAGTLTSSGNLTFTGTGNRITGDFSNATLTNRVSFQSSTANGTTAIQAIPNGTATQTQFALYSDSAITNGNYGDITLSNTEFRFRTNLLGTGTAVPMTFSTGGSERMRIDSSGNVGIGTASPAAKLDLGSGNLNFSSTAQRITGDFTNATIANRVIFQSSTTNGGTFVSAIPNGSGAQAGFVAYAQSDPANASSLSILPQSAASQWSIRSGLTGTGTYLPITFYTGGLESLRIDTSGNVGIGTSSPSQKLDVNGLGRMRFISGTGAGHWLDTTGNASRFFVGSDAAAEAWRVYDSIGGANRIYLDSSGNVGIGTSSPGVKLDVTGSVRASQSVTIGNGGGTYQAGSIYSDASWGMLFRAAQASPSLAQFRWSNSADTELMRIDTSGNVGIGASSSGSKLYVNGTITSAANSPEGGQIDFNNPDNLSTGMVVDISTANNGRVFGTANNFNLQIGQLGGTGGSVILYTAGAERFRVGSSGQFGVGATPSYGTSGQVLTSGGASAAPSWTTVSGGSGTVTSIATGTGLTGGTITTSGTISLVTTALAVGTYAMLYSTAASITAGSTYAGSGLKTSAMYLTGGCFPIPTWYSTGATQSGTWQAMGTYAASGNGGMCLFIRIA